MNKMLIFLGGIVGGALGGWLGEQWGMLTSFVISGLGSIVGIYAGWRLARSLE